MKKIVVIFFIFFLQYSFVLANTNIAFIDMDKILSTTKPGSSIIKQLNEISNKNKINFEKYEKNLMKKEKQLISQKNILSDKDFQLNLNQLKIEVKSYNDNRKKIINDFNKLKITNTNKLLKMINLLLIEYTKEKSISLILQKKNLIMGKTELDITDQLIIIVNSDIDEFKIK